MQSKYELISKRATTLAACIPVLLLTAVFAAEAQMPPLTVSEVGSSNSEPTIYATTDDVAFAISPSTGLIQRLKPEAASVVITATPTFSPNGGNYSSPQIVTVKSSTAGAQIYYTLDGTAPTVASSFYHGAIPINSNTTIRAIAAARGLAASSIASASFQVPSLTWPASGTSLGTFSRSNYFPPNILTSISVPEAVDRHEIAPDWYMSAVYRLGSVMSANGVNVTGLCGLGFFNGAKITLQCSHDLPLGLNVISIIASDQLSSMVGIFTLNVKP